MKRTLTLLGLVACLSAGAENYTPQGLSPQAVSEWSQAWSQGKNAQQSLRTFTLDNGMTLIVQPDSRAPTAVHMVWLRVGSMDEVDGTSGVAHVLEHMLFKGSKTLAPGEFSRRVAALGGQENAFTSRDYTGYYQQVPADRLRDVMALEADRFANNHWPDAEFDKEIQVVKEERRMRTEDNPRSMLMEHLSATMFMANPYRRPIVGWMNDLDAMTAEDVRDFYRKWYVPANAAIVVAGDVDPEQVLAWAKATYGQIPAAAAVPARKPREEPAQLGMRRIVVQQPAEQAVVTLAWKVPTIGKVQGLEAHEQDALALLVLSDVLDGYEGARLARALVQGPQRVADAAASSASVIARGPGTFMLRGIPAKGQTPEAVEAALRAQVAKIAKEGVTPAELQRVKTQWMASAIYERDPVMGQAQSLGSYWVLGMPVDAEEHLMRALMEVTAEQVQAVAAKYFGDDQLTVATLQPQARATAPVAAPAQQLSGDVR